MTTQPALDSRIASMAPSQSIHLGGDSAQWTTVERSGDGRRVRFVRHTPKGFNVFSDTAF